MVEALKLEAVDRFEDMEIDYPELKVSLVRGQGVLMLQRAQSVSDQDVKTVSEVTSIPIPLDNCRVVKAGNSAEVCSVSPTMWFLQTSYEEVAKNLKVLNEAGNDKSIYATDMSDQLVCLEVSGDKATALFSKGCSLDFREENFPVENSARSLLGQANVIFNHVGSNKFHLLLDVSLLNYLWSWLEEVTVEFSV